MLLDNIYIIKAYVGLLSQAMILGHRDLVVARKDKTEKLYAMNLVMSYLAYLLTNAGVKFPVYLLCQSLAHMSI